MATARRLRPQPRRPEHSMIRRLAYIIGPVVAASGVAMLAPAVVSLIYREWDIALGITLAAGITLASGALLWRIVGRSGTVTTREGFAAVGLAWIVMSLFGTLPYLITGSIGSVTNAVFETVAGFTTTGSSILSDPGLLSHGIGSWRALTQWLGGMGIIVLSIAVLPLLGVGGVQLARAESPGPQPDRLTPRFRETAKRLWLLYVGFTVVEIVLLSAGEMTVYQGFIHGLTTMSTGGFGTEANSIAGFSPYTQWVIVFFMFSAGASFALHYRGLRKPAEYPRSAEFRVYVGLWVASIGVITVGTLGSGPLRDVIRDAAFTATSIITTTGYATADYDQWVSGLRIFIVGLMFLGGMAGSTAGAVKTFRLAVLTKAAAVDLRRLIHPRGIFVTHLGKDRVPDGIIESVQSFFLFYMFLFMTGTFLFGIIESTASAGLDLATSASAVASALGNIGPGLSEVGPTSNFAAVPGLGKWLLSFLMIAGRLEIFPVLLLFTPELWRR